MCPREALQRHNSSYTEVCTWNSGWLLPWKRLFLHTDNKKGSHWICWSILQMSKVIQNEYSPRIIQWWHKHPSAEQEFAPGSFRAGQSCTIFWLAASYGTGLWEHRHEAGSWQGWELENQAGDFFQPYTCISHKKVEGREERILIQMLSFSCGLQRI